MTSTQAHDVAYTVGNAARGGMVTGGLTADGQVWINCSFGAGITVKLPAGEAAAFLSAMLKLVQQEHGGRH